MPLFLMQNSKKCHFFLLRRKSRGLDNKKAGSLDPAFLLALGEALIPEIAGLAFLRYDGRDLVAVFVPELHLELFFGLHGGAHLL